MTGRPRGPWAHAETVDPAATVKALRAAASAGIMPTEVARAAGTAASFVKDWTYTPKQTMLASTSDRILDAVEFLVAQRRQRLSRALDAVKSARPIPPEPKFPTEPLRELIIARCGSLKGAAHVGRITHSDLRHLYDDTVSLDTADRLCLEFGVMLEELYADNEDAA